MSYFATITPTRYGYLARFKKRGYDFLPTDIFPNGGSVPDVDVSWATSELTGFRATRWRRSRAGIERAADRFLRRLNASDQTRDQRRAASYEYIGVD